jgi:hypothetical protein
VRRASTLRVVTFQVIFKRCDYDDALTRLGRSSKIRGALRRATMRRSAGSGLRKVGYRDDYAARLRLSVLPDVSGCRIVTHLLVMWGRPGRTSDPCRSVANSNAFGHNLAC